METDTAKLSKHSITDYSITVCTIRNSSSTSLFSQLLSFFWEIYILSLFRIPCASKDLLGLIRWLLAVRIKSSVYSKSFATKIYRFTSFLTFTLWIKSENREPVKFRQKRISKDIFPIKMCNNAVWWMNIIFPYRFSEEKSDSEFNSSLSRMICCSAIGILYSFYKINMCNRHYQNCLLDFLYCRWWSH